MSEAEFKEYWANLPRIRVSTEKLLDLVIRAQGGDRRAGDHLMRATLRLVPHWIARKGFVHIAPLKPHLMDLVLAGNVGLALAIRDFDPERGNGFTTYALWKIKGEVYREAARTSLVSRGRGKEVDAWKIRIAEENFERDHGRKPSTKADHEWIAESTGLPVAHVTDYFVNPVRWVTSLNEECYEGEDGATKMDHLVDVYAHLHIEQSAEGTLMETGTEKLLSCLPEADRQVLTLLFGINGGDACSHDDVAASMGLSVPRVKAIEARALRWLKNSSECYAYRKELREHQL